MGEAMRAARAGRRVTGGCRTRCGPLAGCGPGLLDQAPGTGRIRLPARIRHRSGPGVPYSRSTYDKAPDRGGKKRR
ncbi:hypothetical protein GCM10010211_29830 [Streptomyces albospinus]|uniref:Uncharacterized protein n=1 Tax=Streptomyces albospinus TaxID=285515 RepID=A0ABQ2V170_9ACTN|nr:hypothetical protein GCM10010211_29830 [Streptomyces albospinus]